MKFSYKRCMKNLRKKEKRLKVVSREYNLLANQMEEVISKYRQVHQKLEQVCCIYIDMFNKKEEEVGVYCYSSLSFQTILIAVFLRLFGFVNKLNTIEGDDKGGLSVGFVKTSGS